MKLKLLIAPFSFVVAIIIFISFVWPEIGLMSANQANIKTDQDLLNDVQTKKQNIEKLKNDLSQESDKSVIINNFLPPDRKDEKIIDGLNFLAKDSSVDLLAMTLEKSATQTAPEPATITAGVVVSAVVSRDINYLTAKIQVTGSYENIKMFLSQIYKMEMFNKISDLTISRVQSQAAPGVKTPSGSGQTLALNTSLDFGYLGSASTGNSMAAPILLQNSFDLKYFDALESLINRKIPALDEGAKGKSNPFQP